MVSIVAVGLVCTFYSTIGGMKAILITDVFQVTIPLDWFSFLFFKDMKGTHFLIKSAIEIIGWWHVKQPISSLIGQLIIFLIIFRLPSSTSFGKKKLSVAGKIFSR